MIGYLLHKNGLPVLTIVAFTVWTPSVQPEDVPAESSSEELLEDDDQAFWQQDPPTDSRAFMSTIWRGMKKIFRGQVKLQKQVEEQDESAFWQQDPPADSRAFMSTIW